MLTQLYDFLVKPWSYAFMVNAGLELTLLSAVLGVVGTLVVLRGMAFFSHSITHAVFPGIVIAYFLNMSFLAGALIVGLLVSLTIGVTAATPRSGHTTTTAVIYSTLFALGVVLVSYFKANKRLSELLFGRLFGVGPEDLWLTGLVGGGVLLAVLALRKEFLFVSFDRRMAQASGLPVTALDLGFYLLLALITIIILPACGNILAVALLITPAATARLLTNRITSMFLLASVLSWMEGLVGLYLSFYLNLPPGASVIAVMSGIFIVGLGVNLFLGRLHESEWLKFRLKKTSLTN